MLKQTKIKTVWVETTAPRLMFLEEALKQGVLDGVTFRAPIPFNCFFLIKGERGWRFATPFVYRGMNIRNQQISALKGQ